MFHCLSVLAGDPLSLWHEEDIDVVSVDQASPGGKLPNSAVAHLCQHDQGLAY